jgi:signal transduction histidine kinase/DNA-binding response OmpR family regulator
VASILIVEDRPVDRKFLATVLRCAGHTVAEAGDGAEALRLATASPPDLVVSDVLMPLVDGYELVRRMRRHPDLATTPVIFYTATYHQREARALAAECGVVDVLTKPSERTVILEKVAASLAAARVPAVPRTTEAEFAAEHLRLLSTTLARKMGDLEASEGRMAAVVLVTQQLSAERDVDALLRAVCAAARGVTLARWAVIGLLDDDGRHTTRSLCFGVDGTEASELQPIDVLATALAPAIAERRTLRLQNPGGRAEGLGLPADRPPTRCCLVAPLLSSQRLHGYLALHDKPGAEEFTAEDERVAGALAAHAGIAYENLRLYDDLRQHARNLEQEVADREALEAMLLQSQKMEAIGQLASGVAHDFNNLLTVIRGYAELLMATLEPDSRHRDDVLQIVGAADRAAGLTRQLLAFSRKQVLQPRLVDLNRLVGETGSMLRRLIGEHVELATKPAPEPALVHADPGQLEQILMNLAVNARDAMPQGGALTIEIANVELDAVFASAAFAAPVGHCVSLAVSDTGTGMDEGVRQRVFEPFFTTKPRGLGTGLGLATVYAIVQQSHGHVVVASEPGQGSTFTIYLPRAADGPGEAANAIEAATAAVGRERVLLAEDDATVRRLARVMLETAGYEVVEAATPQEAEEALAQADRPVELLLSDVVMPGTSGPALHARLAARQPGLRVVYMSGHADDAVGRAGTPEGVVFLQKPFTAAALRAKVREALDR